MIPVQKVVSQLRMELQDMNEVKYSDWDLINAINKALRTLAIKMSMMNTDFFEKCIQIEDPREGVDLPADYLTLTDVLDLHGRRMSPASDRLKPWNYTITGNKVYAMHPILLKYHGFVPEAEMGGSIEIPMTLFDMLVLVTKMVIEGSPMDALSEYITQNSKDLIPSRRYAHVKLGMPFRV